MADPLARACIVPSHLEKGLIVADLIKLRLDREHDATFICSAINGTEFRREAERLATGTTRTRISLSTLKRIGLRAPKPKEQRRIGDR
jgi:type I restriction enzyme S subunit